MLRSTLPLTTGKWFAGGKISSARNFFFYDLLNLRNKAVCRLFKGNDDHFVMR